MQLSKSATVIVCMYLSACGSNDACDRPLPYLNSQIGGELIIPEDLTRPSSDDQQTIPPVSNNRKDRSNPCTAGPPELVIEKVERVDEATLAAVDTSVEQRPLTIGPGFNSESVEDTLREWIESWRTANAARYLSFYAQDFVGSDDVKERETWLRRRQELLEMTGEANISIRDISVEDLPAGRKLVRLIQDFQNGEELHSVVKVIEMIRENEGWRIRREQVVEVL